jgi:hypothetical protein
MEYLIVSCPDKRRILVDGVFLGTTGEAGDRTFTVATGTHRITLDPPTGVSPTFHDVVLVGTSPTHPHHVAFGVLR